jgi:hypothetical protein
MDLVLIELLLWGGLVFFFWALKDGLGHVESDIESLGLLNNPRAAAQPSSGVRYVHPERLLDPIGSYQDAPIHRYAIIDGRKYQFDRVCPAQSGMTLDTDERCVAPGLVYRECEV